jgi:predicted signal transduction protein with EAL and GGDEF domain
MPYFDFRDKEWPVIASAPHIVFWALVILVILAILVILVILVIKRREFARLKAEKAALSERLSLAHDEHAMVTQQVETLTEQVAQLSQQIAQNDAISKLAYTSDTVTGTVHALSNTNNALGRIVTPALT